MIKKLILLLALLAIAGGIYWAVKPVGDDVALEEGYRWLYDGSLDGWRAVGGEASFAADGDAIVGRRGPGPNTFLRTEEEFTDFNLRMQFRWEEHGNSGVMFRAQQRDGDGRTYGYQFELDPSERAWSGGIYDESRRGWLASLEGNEKARQAIKLNDWNDIEIEARGATLKTWLNGEPIASLVDVFGLKGFIALQVHSGDTGVMRWRRIRIKELDPFVKVGAAFAADDWELDGSGELQVAGPEVQLSSFANGSDADLPWLAPKRRFNDAAFELDVPVCEQATLLQIRYDAGDGAGQESYAELAVTADRAEGRLLNAGEVSAAVSLSLDTGESHRLRALALGDQLVLSVNEQDVLRVPASGLDDRGQFRIRPTLCADPFTIENFRWLDVREPRDEVDFYKTLATEPAPVLSPDEALAAFRVAPGFEVELVAAEPLVAEPVAMSWDEYGRLYVVEMRGYMRDAYGTDSNLPVGQVVRLEDQDGDGRMDRSELFLGELVNPRGVAVVNDGVLIAEPPTLWLCELPSRTASCTNKKAVGAYAADVEAANVEHMENGLLPGLDNWLYNSKSGRRLRLANGELIEQEGPFRGQWGIAKDDQGRLFYNHNSTWLQVDLFPGDDIHTPGIDEPLAGIGVNLTRPAEVFSVRVNPGVNRAYLKDTLRPDGRLKEATGVSGLTVYRGSQFPPQYKGHVFVPESAGNVVAQFAISEQGMELSAEQQLYPDPDWQQRDFLGSTDERFRPVDAMNGPDGALYIIDMYRGIIQDDHFLTDELRDQIFQRGLDKPIGMGRIWRIRHKTTDSERDFPALAEASAGELVAALSHPNGWVRDTAQRLLLQRGLKAAEQLQRLALRGETIPALHAIWALAGREELTPSLLDELLQADDSARVVHALRAGSHLLSQEALLAFAQQPELDAAQARQALLALAAHSKAPAVREQIVGVLQSRVENPYVRQAAVKAVQGRELRFLQELFTAGGLGPEGEAAQELLATLAANAYRSLRSDLTVTAPTDSRLLELLELIATRELGNTWQQLAMLKGLARLPITEGFVPVEFDAPPPIFADTSISAKNPLWDARLKARPAFTWPGDELAMGLTPLGPEQQALLERGKAFYKTCANCHGANGTGIDGLAPSLVGTEWVTGPPEWLGRIILQGMSGPLEVNGEQWNGVMPPHGHLDELNDDTLAGLMTYLRRSWGNKAKPVSAEMVADIRAKTEGRSQPWTAAELKNVPFDRGFRRFVGEYKVSFITFTITETPEGLNMAVPMYGGGVLEQINDTQFRGVTGDSEVLLDFQLDGDGPAQSFVLHRDGQKIPVERKE